MVRVDAAGFPYAAAGAIIRLELAVIGAARSIRDIATATAIGAGFTEHRFFAVEAHWRSMMKGHPEVIEQLNALLAGELTAIDQYFVHSRMQQDWGYSKLFARIDHEMREEQTHADALIRRILFLEGRPNLAHREPLNVGASVPEMFRNDLAVEYRVVTHLQQVIALCESVQDYDTRRILLQLLKDTEEDHTYWLETQLGLIEKIGLENYLQTQL